MANAALENLSAATTVAGTDLVPIKQAGATLLKATVNQLATGILSGDAVASGGTANGILYLSGSKVASSGSALTLNGDTLNIVGNASATGNFYLKTAGAKLAWDVSGVYFNWIESGGTSGADYLRFGITNAEAMRLTATGLGVGTSEIEHRLEVVNNQNANSWGRVRNNSSGAAAYAGIGVNAYGNSWGFRIGSVAANANTLEIVKDAFGSPVVMAALDLYGNLGLGVTPSAWDAAGYKALEIGAKGNAVFSAVNNAFLNVNAYYSGGWKYGTTNKATQYEQNDGQHRWLVAPSGTAGAAISFTQAMTLTAAGSLGVGTTAPVARINSQITDSRAWTPSLEVSLLSIGNDSYTNNSAALYQSSVYYGDGTFSSVKFGAVASGSYSADFVLANRNAGTHQENLRITANGNLIAKVNATAPTLSTNGTMSFELTSDTSLKIVVRGSDGTTRSASLTLA